MAAWFGLGSVGGTVATVSTVAVVVAGGVYGAMTLQEASQDPDPVPPQEASVEVTPDAPSLEAPSSAEVVEASPEPEAEETPAAPSRLPSFDVVRVDAGGNAIMAGRALPNASVAVLVDGDEVHRTVADTSGSFAAIFGLTEATKTRVVSLTMEIEGADPVASTETVILAPVQPEPDVDFAALAAPSAETPLMPDGPAEKPEAVETVEGTPASDILETDTALVVEAEQGDTLAAAEDTTQGTEIATPDLARVDGPGEAPEVIPEEVAELSTPPRVEETPNSVAAVVAETPSAEEDTTSTTAEVVEPEVAPEGEVALADITPEEPPTVELATEDTSSVDTVLADTSPADSTPVDMTPTDTALVDTQTAETTSEDRDPVVETEVATATDDAPAQPSSTLTIATSDIVPIEPEGDAEGVEVALIDTSPRDEVTHEVALETDVVRDEGAPEPTEVFTPQSTNEGLVQDNVLPVEAEETDPEVVVATTQPEQDPDTAGDVAAVAVAEAPDVTEVTETEQAAPEPTPEPTVIVATADTDTTPVEAVEEVASDENVTPVPLSVIETEQPEVVALVEEGSSAAPDADPEKTVVSAARAVEPDVVPVAEAEGVNEVDTSVAPEVEQTTPDIEVAAATTLVSEETPLVVTPDVPQTTTSAPEVASDVEPVVEPETTVAESETTVVEPETTQVAAAEVTETEPKIEEFSTDVGDGPAIAAPSIDGSSPTLSTNGTGTAPVQNVPQAPSVLLADESGIRVLQSGGSAPVTTQSVIIDTISYDTTGDVALGGRGTGSSFVRVYLNNQPIKTARIGLDGQWRTPLPEVDTGVYTLRVDELNEEGEVTSRMETPFKREEPEVIAALDSRDEDAQVDTGVITVQPGHSLWKIARERYGQGELYVQVYRANRSRIRNPDLIYPGQVFTLPE